MKFNIYSVHVELTEDILGSYPSDPQIYTNYLAERATKRKSAPLDVETPQELVEEEAEAIVQNDQKGITVFPRDEEGLFLFDYQVKGFLKNAGNTLKDQLNIKALRSKIDNLVFIKPRKIYFYRGDEIIKEPDGIFERPLRAMTMQGPRVSLAASEYIKKGATLDFEIWVLENKEITKKVLEQLLAYGKFLGLLQWRNGGFGTFEAELFELKPKDVAI